MRDFCRIACVLSTPMLAEQPIDGAARKIRVREAEQAARALLGRASYLEKLAERPRTGSTDRRRLSRTARELRTAADQLLAEICELSRQAVV
jgi:hypothetical protein